jgi:hypothetical protein
MEFTNEQLAKIAELLAKHAVTIAPPQVTISNVSGDNNVALDYKTQPSTTESSSTCDNNSRPIKTPILDSTIKILESAGPASGSVAYLLDMAHIYASQLKRLEELINKTNYINCSLKHVLEPLKQQVLLTKTNTNLNSIRIPFPNSINVAYDGPTGPTGVTSTNNGISKPESIGVPSHLKDILGTWKGCIGANLVSIKFEFTSERKNLLAYFTLFTQPQLPFNNYSDMVSAPESLSTKVNYNNCHNTLFIEDVPGVLIGPMTAWLINGNIIGKVTDGSQVHLVKDSKSC